MDDLNQLIYVVETKDRKSLILRTMNDFSWEPG